MSFDFSAATDKKSAISFQARQVKLDPNSYEDCYSTRQFLYLHQWI